MQLQHVLPKALAGDHVGFRVKAPPGATPIGAIVVRVNDKWVEAVAAAVCDGLDNSAGAKFYRLIRVFDFERPELSTVR